MASAASVTSLADEVNCPICQGTLREPVTIDCGHNFCRGCLTRYCEIPGPDLEESPTCPLCKEPFRPGSFRPNWQLANVVENIERLQLVSTQGLGEEDACQEHGEKIYFFCEDDEMQLCVVCREAGEHAAHTMRFLEDAAAPYREQIHKCLKCLRKEREEIQEIQSRENKRMQVLLDIRSTLIRCETRKCRKPVAVSPELGQRIRDFPQQALPLQREMKMFLEKLHFELDYEPAHISLDPQTSHPKLILSEDRQRAQFSYKWQNSPDNPQRFDRATCVLAHTGITGGRHTWVVSIDLAHGGSCTMGVVSEDVQRKGELRLRPEEGVWAVRLAWGFVSALGSFPTRLTLKEQPRQVRVSLDYEVGWVTFTNAATREPIYTFTASFTRKVIPFFGLWGRGSSFSLSS
ncbi:tripartite motif-containing protein 10 isoform X2 [Piliocolobus tephrosceles]|uniref:tripartite motif-containing protein 10 isoform X2 n=1 Tax=Piliocolobus tephrosceles TaxID=591936 RepID=UPI000E6B4508|nr:tripartite motif-containing protein 10 isoform X2 [Piliocolobus tephrosceles]